MIMNIINNTIKNRVFYSVIGFKDKTQYATFSKDNYVKKGNAQRVAQRLITNGYERVVLRREEVWFRNDSNEFSCSSPIEIYNYKGYKFLKS